MLKIVKASIITVVAIYRVRKYVKYVNVWSHSFAISESMRKPPWEFIIHEALASQHSDSASGGQTLV